VPSFAFARSPILIFVSVPHIQIALRGVTLVAALEEEESEGDAWY
jgi:hypothetical protein